MAVVRFVLCHPSETVDQELREVFLASRLIEQGHDVAVLVSHPGETSDTVYYHPFLTPVSYFPSDVKGDAPHTTYSTELLSALFDSRPDLVVIKGIDYKLASIIINAEHEFGVVVVIGGTSQHDLLSKADVVFYETQQQIVQHNNFAKYAILPKYIKWRDVPDGSAEKKYDIVNVGNFDEPRKAQEILLPFAEKFKIALIGDGIRRKHMEDLVGGNKNIAFHGYKPRPDVLKIVAESRLMVHTSYWDGYPRAVAESLSCGVPVLGRKNVLDGVGFAPFVICCDIQHLYMTGFDLLANPDRLSQYGALGKAFMNFESSEDNIWSVFYEQVKDLIPVENA